MATAAAAIVAKARRDVVSHFMAHDAVTPDKAIAFVPDRRVRRRQFERMVDAGVIHEAKPGQFYLDIPAYDEATRKRRRRAGLAVLGATLAAATAALFAG
jgi:hypothetical protein